MVKLRADRANATTMEELKKKLGNRTLYEHHLLLSNGRQRVSPIKSFRAQIQPLGMLSRMWDPSASAKYHEKAGN